MITAEELVLELNDSEESKNFKLATVVDLFDNDTAKIQFDGEDTPSEKQYAYLKSYTPNESDRVLLAALGGTYIILGKVNYNESPDTEEEIDRYLFDLKTVNILKGMQVSGTAIFNNGMSVVGNIGVDGAITATSLSASGNVTASGNLSGANISTSGILNAGTSTLSKLEVSGDTDLSGTLTADGTLTARGSFRHSGPILGFFSATPTNRRSIPYYMMGGGTPTVEGLRDKVNDILAALKAYGLIS